MLAYKVKCRTRRKGNLSVPEGEWQFMEKTVVAGDCATEAIAAVHEFLDGVEFRLVGVEVTGDVDLVARRILEQV